MPAFEILSQEEELAKLRGVAVLWLERIAQITQHAGLTLNAYCTGMVADGTAGADSVVHLHLFTDAEKELAMSFLDAGLPYEISEYEIFNTKLSHSVFPAWVFEHANKNENDNEIIPVVLTILGSNALFLTQKKSLKNGQAAYLKREDLAALIMQNEEAHDEI